MESFDRWIIIFCKSCFLTLACVGVLSFTALLVLVLKTVFLPVFGDLLL